MTRRRPRTYRLGEDQMRHIVGVKADHDGWCRRCDDPIVVGERVVRQGDGWIHCRCASGATDE